MPPRLLFRRFIATLLFGLVSCTPILATGKTNAQPDHSILTTAGTNGATSGANTAFTGVTYNYLSHAQEKQRDKERKECVGVTECLQVEAKWALISAEQDAGIVTGVVGGMALSTYEIVAGLYEIVARWAIPRKPQETTAFTI